MAMGDANADLGVAGTAAAHVPEEQSTTEPRPASPIRYSATYHHGARPVEPVGDAPDEKRKNDDTITSGTPGNNATEPIGDELVKKRKIDDTVAPGTPDQNATEPESTTEQNLVDAVMPGTTPDQNAAESDSATEQVNQRKIDAAVEEASRGDKDSRCETILNKHAKTFDVYGRVAQSQAFKLFLDAISLIIPEGSFEITKNDSFCGITLESVDLARSCLVQGRLSCQIEDGRGSEECKRGFCIRIQALKDCLKTASGHHFVDLWLNDNGALNVKVFEPDIGGFAPEFNIRTLFKENEKIPISNLNYEFYVEINIKMFQQIMKLCRDHKSDTIKLEVGETDVDTIFFVMSYESDEVNGYFPIYSSSGTEKGGAHAITHIKASDDVISSKITRENIKIKYSNRFSSEYLNLFTKNMDRHFVSLRLAEGKPLLIDYPLGIAGNDRIRFILAPKEG